VSADGHCPECGGPPALKLVLKDRLVKACEDCGHKWNEPREPDLVRKGGWVSR
jgi:hypothetical protein